MIGPNVFVNTLSARVKTDKAGRAWQYHSRSDHHSKVASVLLLIDLLSRSPLMQKHARKGLIAFGVNHEMRDFKSDRKKNLDLVICTPSVNSNSARLRSLTDLLIEYDIVLNESENRSVLELPPIREASVGSVLVAVEAKACMTAHQKALPRLYDELNSSHLTIHAASAEALAVGLVCVNAASTFASPDRNKGLVEGQPLIMTQHKQPFATRITLDKIARLPRRTRISEEGYDAIGVVVVDLANDGTRVNLVDTQPAPIPGENHHYSTMIERIAANYAARFSHL